MDSLPCLPYFCVGFRMVRKKKKKKENIRVGLTWVQLPKFVCIFFYVF